MGISSSSPIPNSAWEVKVRNLEREIREFDSLVEGGQGRTREDVARDAKVIGLVGLVAIGVGGLFIVVQLLLHPPQFLR